MKRKLQKSVKRTEKRRQPLRSQRTSTLLRPAKRDYGGQAPVTEEKSWRIAGLDCRIKESIANGIIHKAAAVELMALPGKDQIAINALMKKVTMNQNTQRNIVMLLRELKTAKNLSAAKMLERIHANDIIQRKDLNPPQKVRKIKDLLEGERRPGLKRHLKACERLKSRLNMPRGLSINNSPPYEDDLLNIGLALRSKEDLKRQIEWLRQFADSPQIKEAVETFTATGEIPPAK